MQYPVKEVKLPKDLKGLENGTLPDKILDDIKPSGQLHHLAARAWEAMRAAAKEDNIDLVHVGAYRPLTAQIDLFKQRYVKGDSGDARKITRKWNNETWMLKPKMAPAGSPGTSNHGWGLAIDVAVKVDGQVLPITSDPDGKGGMKSGLDWMFKNADKFGFSWEVKEGAQAEAWHVRYYPGEDVPEAVAAFHAAKGGAPVQAAATPAPAPAAAPAPAPAGKGKKKALNPTPDLKRGDKGEAVLKFQQEMQKDGFQIKADGDFGPGTVKHVREFRKKHGLPDGDTVDASFWEILLK